MEILLFISASGCQGSVRLVLAYLFLRQFLLVHDVPDVGYVADNERHEQRHVEHGAQGELAATAVGDGQRTLQVGVGRVVGGGVVTSAEQQAEYCEHRADACGPDAVYVGVAHGGAHGAVEQQRHADGEHDEQRPHRDEVVEIFLRLHDYHACGLVNGEAVFQQSAYEERQQSTLPCAS